MNVTDAVASRRSVRAFLPRPVDPALLRGVLLLREARLDSCAQEAWAMYQAQIRDVVAIPDDHIFFCGMAIGWGDRDAAINRFAVPGVPLDETVRWEGFE